jgi:hypothetical protein
MSQAETTGRGMRVTAGSALRGKLAVAFRAARKDALRAALTTTWAGAAEAAIS